MPGSAVHPPPDSPGIDHPRVTLPSDQSRPFTLRTDPTTNWYRMWFQYELGPGQNPNNWQVRVFAATFKTSVADPIWIASPVVATTGEYARNLFVLQHPELGDATDLWVGAWWDDGTYGTGARADVIRYFTDHPAEGIHHTVPIRIG